MKILFALLFSTSLAINLLQAMHAGSASASKPATGVRTVQVATPGTQDADAGKLAQLLALEREHLPAVSATGYRYWDSSATAGSEQRRDIERARQAMRDALTAQFGVGAERDPVFGPLFRPLDPVHAYLTSAQQLAIEQLRRDRDTRLQQASAAARGGVVPEQAVYDAEQDYQQALAALLDADTLFEFQLRDSPLARQLRDSPVVFTEPEFRQAFAALQSLQDTGGAVDDVIAVRDELRSLLGDQRFTQLWAARDPVFARLQRATERLGLPEASLLSAYQVLNDFQDRKMQAARLAEVDAASAAAQSAALRDAERDALSRVVGADVADEILRARAAETFSLARGYRSDR